jgi:hypothetical protein
VKWEGGLIICTKALKRKFIFILCGRVDGQDQSPMESCMEESTELTDTSRLGFQGRYQGNN